MKLKQKLKGDKSNMTSSHIKEDQLELDLNLKEKKTTNISKRMWKATSSSTVLEGKIVDEMTDEKGWALVKIDWNLPHSDYEIDEWQRLANIRVV